MGVRREEKVRERRKWERNRRGKSDRDERKRR